jgi:DNA-binding transcriptional LysR family regulator
MSQRPAARIWGLNLRHLKAVAKIVEHGTVKAAGFAINLTQSGVTQALGRLEVQIGATLFERRASGMVPTEAALLLAPRIDAATAHLPSSRVTMSRLRAMLALAETGDFRKAGQATCLSVSSIYRAVRDLEIAMNRKLISGRGLHLALTEAGLQVAADFRLARIELETGLSEVAALRGAGPSWNRSEWQPSPRLIVEKIGRPAK